MAQAVGHSGSLPPATCQIIQLVKMGVVRPRWLTLSTAICFCLSLLLHSIPPSTHPYLKLLGSADVCQSKSLQYLIPQLQCAWFHWSLSSVSFSSVDWACFTHSFLLDCLLTFYLLISCPWSALVQTFQSGTSGVVTWNSSSSSKKKPAIHWAPLGGLTIIQSVPWAGLTPLSSCALEPRTTIATTITL